MFIYNSEGKTKADAICTDLQVTTIYHLIIQRNLGVELIRQIIMPQLCLNMVLQQGVFM